MNQLYLVFQWALVSVLTLCSASTLFAATKTTTSTLAGGAITFAVADSWKIINKSSDQAIAWEIVYRATQGTPESANAVVRVIPELTGEQYTTVSDALRNVSQISSQGALLNDVTVTGSRCRTLVWTARQKHTPYMIVDAYILSPRNPLLCRVAFPLMESQAGLADFIEQANILLTSLQADGRNWSGGMLELREGLVRFRASGPDLINPDGTYDVALVAEPSKLNLLSPRVLRRATDALQGPQEAQPGDISAGKKTE